MENFEYLSPTKIIFGKGTENQAGEEVKQYAGKALVVANYDKGYLKDSGLYDRVVKSLEKAGVEYASLNGIKPNPRLSTVQEGIKICREKNIGFILAVGGGSVIDTAKAIAMGVPYSGDVWDFFMGKAEIENVLPVGAILTLAGSGSESSFSVVITNEEQDNLKRALDSDLVRPKFAIMNPELTASVPIYSTACGITDIMSHTMERYFTNVKNVEFTDRLCEAVLKTMINVAGDVMKDPSDYNARAEIMWAGTISHNNLVGTGRIGDWACHMMEHEISRINDIAHGAGLAIITPAWMKYVYKANPAIFEQFAVRVMGVEQYFGNPEKTIKKGIDRLIQFYQSIGMPVSLREVGISKDQFPAIAESCKKFDEEAGTVGNFLPLTNKDIVEIMELAY